MTNDVDKRAAKLVEVEKEREAEKESRRREQAEASRLTDARKRIKQHDREIAQEQARKEAEAEATDLARQRHELEERLEREAAALNLSLADLEALDRRHLDALRRAGRPPGHGQHLAALITRWWLARFGGWNSLTGTPSPHWNAEDRPLPESDPLASS
jgi:vacuolar-type H+-ATPase subunit I/STV1